MGAYKCCNHDNCGQSFDDKETRDRHEMFYSVPPPPDPPEPQTDERAS